MDITLENKIHTIIFDLDGTLSDSAILTLASLEQIAPAHGLPVPSMKDIRKATGNANPEFYYILYPDYPRDMVYGIGQEIEHDEPRVLSLATDKLLFKGCRELLVSLKSNGIRLNIASTGDRNHVFSILEETGIIGLFDEVSCHRPDKYEMLKEMIKGDTAGYIMVGDMKKDYEAAAKNGIVSVGACFGYCVREHSDFDIYIDEPLDLLKVLNLTGAKN